MTPSSVCQALVKDFESCAKLRKDGRYDAYPDPGSGGDPWTIGWGSTGADIKRGTIWTQAQCDERFGRDLYEFSGGVAAALAGAKTTQHQFDALVSFAYNVGLGNLRGSTLLALHRHGDFGGAARQFARWNLANGKIMAGLIRRRAAEASLYGRAA
jgi:lysozyme